MRCLFLQGAPAEGQCHQLQVLEVVLYHQQEADLYHLLEVAETGLVPQLVVQEVGVDPLLAVPGVALVLQLVMQEVGVDLQLGVPEAGVVPQLEVQEVGVVPQLEVPEAGVAPQQEVQEAGVAPQLEVQEVGVVPPQQVQGVDLVHQQEVIEAGLVPMLAVVGVGLVPLLAVQEVGQLEADLGLHQEVQEVDQDQQLVAEVALAPQQAAKKVVLEEADLDHQLGAGQGQEVGQVLLHLEVVGVVLVQQTVEVAHRHFPHMAVQKVGRDHQLAEVGQFHQRVLEVERVLQPEVGKIQKVVMKKGKPLLIMLLVLLITMLALIKYLIVREKVMYWHGKIINCC